MNLNYTKKQFLFYRWMIGISVVILLLVIFSVSVYAASIQDAQDLDFSQLQEILEEAEDIPSISFQELFNLVLEGNFGEIGSKLTATVIDSLINSVKQNQAGLQKVLLLAVLLAVYSVLASAFSNHTIPEAGFYITYLLLVVLLVKSFEAAWQTAFTLITHLFDFSAALLPAFFLSVAYSGNQTAAVGYYQIALILLTVTEWLFFKVFMPAIRIYLILSLLNELAEEGYFSSLLHMLGRGIRNAQKYVMAGVMGLQLIQGLILPQVDAVKNQALLKAVSAIPGIGGVSQTISSTILGSGVLIRNGIGVTAMICLAALCLVPFLQMSVMSILYHLSAALIAPIADKRVTTCINKTAEGVGLLIKITFSSLAVFIILIAGVCLMTGNGG